MVKTSKGDYKFPGGGIEEGESLYEALAREISEETGYIISNNASLAGKAIERRQDSVRDDGIFEMISYYYFCDVCSNRSMQKLDDYELKQDFKPIWVNIEYAYRENLQVLNNSIDKNDWVERETLVLKELVELL
jgi:8-oxo-dGTP pyrophosphatase MutT (NUDIX family)